jgi:sugar phosphate isomerase/epimerase
MRSCGVLLGLMNDPARPLGEELARIAGLGFELVDLTLEPQGAWPVDAAEVRRQLDAHGLRAVGHTAPFLPFASAFPELERTGRELFVRACETFAEIGVTLVNLHPAMRGLRGRNPVERNAEAVAEVAARAAELGLTVMVENMGGAFGTPEELGPLVEAAPNVRFHLDVGHANVRPYGQPPRLPLLLEAFGDRIAHVHVHDNKGRYDEHLPLGVGSVDWSAAARALRATGYDGTVTLEVFAKEPAYTEASRRLWLDWWGAAGASAGVTGDSPPDTADPEMANS